MSVIGLLTKSLVVGGAFATIATAGTSSLFSKGNLNSQKDNKGLGPKAKGKTRPSHPPSAFKKCKVLLTSEEEKQKVLICNDIDKSGKELFKEQGVGYLFNSFDHSLNKISGIITRNIKQQQTLMPNDQMWKDRLWQGYYVSIVGAVHPQKVFEPAFKIAYSDSGDFEFPFFSILKGEAISWNGNLNATFGKDPLKLTLLEIQKHSDNRGLKKPINSELCYLGWTNYWEESTCSFPP